MLFDHWNVSSNENNEFSFTVTSSPQSMLLSHQVGWISVQRFKSHSTSQQFKLAAATYWNICSLSYSTKRLKSAYWKPHIFCFDILRKSVKLFNNSYSTLFSRWRSPRCWILLKCHIRQISWLIYHRCFFCCSYDDIGQAVQKL